MNTFQLPKWFLPMSVALTAIIYLCGINGIFTYDDYHQIVDRPQLHNIFNLHDILYCGLRQNRVWANVSFALNWTLTPGHAYSFKVFSLLLHFLNGLILFKLLKKVFAEKPALPILATAIFLLHPLQIQSLAYVMGVLSPIQAFFYLISLWWIAKYSLTRFWTLLVILVASLFSKETSVLIPIVLLSYEILVNGSKVRDLPKLKWTVLFAIPFLYLPLYAVLKDPVSMYEWTTGFHLFPFWQYIASQLYFQSFYVALFLNPSLQSVLHGNPGLDFVEIVGMVLGALIWTGSFIFICRSGKKYPRTAFFMIFFFVAYLPTNSVLQMINPFAEYRLYQSNISLCLLAAFLIERFYVWLADKRQLKSAPIFVPVLVLAYWSIFTFFNVMVWTNGVKVYTQAIKHYPTNDTAYMALANEYLQIHDLKSAYFYFYEARFFSGWLSATLARDFYIVARAYFNDGDYRHAWEILDFMDKDLGKDPLPPEFLVIRDQTKKKMQSLGFSLETGFDKANQIQEKIRQRVLEDRLKNGY